MVVAEREIHLLVSRGIDNQCVDHEIARAKFIKQRAIAVVRTSRIYKYTNGVLTHVLGPVDSQIAVEWSRIVVQAYRL